MEARPSDRKNSGRHGDCHLNHAILEFPEHLDDHASTHAAGAARSRDSHYRKRQRRTFRESLFFLVLPPLFVFVRADYGLDYTELALAITVFNVVWAIFQTPTGMLADRFGSFSILIAGLLLGSLAFAAVALVRGEARS